MRTISIIIIISISLIMVGVMSMMGFLGLGLFTLFRQIDETQSISLAGVDEIQVNMTNERIHIYQNGDGDEIELHYYGKSTQNIKLTSERNGDSIVIEAKDPKFSSSLRLFCPKPEDLYLDVYLPAGYEGKLSIDNASGAVLTDALHLEDFQLHISSGKLEAEELLAEKVFIKTSSGKVQIDKLETDDVMIVSSSSSITIDEYIAKDGKLETSSGNISLNDSTGNINIKTGSGKITLNDHTGDLDAETTSGKAQISYKEFENQQMFIKTSSGNISLELPPSAEFMVEATSNSGNFKTDFSMVPTGHADAEDIKGQVGEKDNPIVLQTSSGNINLMKQ